MNKFLPTLFLSVGLIASVTVMAQEEGENLCTKNLNKATKEYESGRLNGIPEILEGCLQNGFTRPEKLQAYRLLILTYLFQDEDEKAEKTLLDLFKLDPEYKVNEALDPAEFVNLYNSYRTLPVINIGLKGGLNLTQIHSLVSYEVDNPTDKQSDYKMMLGYQIGLNVDFLIHNKWQLSTDLLFTGKKYQYTNDILDYSKLVFTERQSWLELPVMLKYTFTKKKLTPYLQAGFSTGLLMSSSASVERLDNVTNSNQAVGPEIETKDLRKKLMFSLVYGGGLRYKVGYGYAVFDVRYQMGLRNATNIEKRYSNPELLYKYGYISDNFLMNNMIFSLGYYKSIYKPKKIKNINE